MAKYQNSALCQKPWFNVIIENLDKNVHAVTQQKGSRRIASDQRTKRCINPASSAVPSDAGALLQIAAWIDFIPRRPLRWFACS